jgi:hypothetical protein
MPCEGPSRPVPRRQESRGHTAMTLRAARRGERYRSRVSYRRRFFALFPGVQFSGLPCRSQQMKQCSLTGTKKGPPRAAHGGPLHVQKRRARVDPVLPGVDRAAFPAHVNFAHSAR